LNLSYIDAGIVLFYLLLVFGVGVYMERRAGKNIDAYFLGGKSMPWWLLGMSGSSSYFDITGTMWMVSTFYLLGIRGMWEHWFYCFPIAGFLFAYKGKWNYRSGVMTNMEWLVFRFGRDRAGQAARLTTVIIYLIVMVLMLGYAGTGIGKFIEEFLPIDKSLAVPILFAFTGLYVILGGFISVVYSDFLQTIILSVASVYIAVAAFMKIDTEAFRQTVGNDWFSVKPVWELANPPTAYADLFGLLVILWVSRGMISLFSLGSTSSGAEFQRFAAAKSEADASKIGFMWGLVISVRWALVMAFTAFGLSILANSSGVVDSERVLPMVLNRVLPVGIKGIVIAGLVAAFMSTFDSTLNVTASYVVNDLVKPIWKKATSKQLMIVSYASTFMVLVLGIIVSLRTEQIRDLWNPINFALLSSLIVPGLVAPYWWRIGGWSHCLSGLNTLIAAVWVYYFTDWNELRYFPVLLGISAISCFFTSSIFPPANEQTLKNYYLKIRPFGLWGPVRKMLKKDGKDADRFARDKFDIPVAIIATCFFIALYLLMIDTVLHNWARAMWLLLFNVASGISLYFLKWRRL
jgi:solute:Na+ symporter, SSS family